MPSEAEWRVTTLRGHVVTVAGNIRATMTVTAVRGWLMDSRVFLSIVGGFPPYHPPAGGSVYERVVFGPSARGRLGHRNTIERLFFSFLREILCMSGWCLGLRPGGSLNDTKGLFHWRVIAYSATPLTSIFP